jgi:hypothetical protein
MYSSRIAAAVRNYVIIFDIHKAFIIFTKTLWMDSAGPFIAYVRN